MFSNDKKIEMLFFVIGKHTYTKHTKIIRAMSHQDSDSDSNSDSEYEEVCDEEDLEEEKEDTEYDIMYWKLVEKEDKAEQMKDRAIHVYNAHFAAETRAKEEADAAKHAAIEAELAYQLATLAAAEAGAKAVIAMRESATARGELSDATMAWIIARDATMEHLTSHDTPEKKRKRDK